jgi:hypothetical protein
MSGRDHPVDFQVVDFKLRGGNVKPGLHSMRWKICAGMAFAGLGLLMAGGTSVMVGCKSAPELTAASAQQMIQAQYDQAAPVGANIRVDDPGMLAGARAKYWERTKVYPNKFWADFKLTDAGKKVVKLPSGGDTIEWRPQHESDHNFAVIVTTVQTNHLRAHDVKDPTDDIGGTKTVQFNEAVSLDGVPQDLQDMAHNPGNKLVTRRTATFSLQNGAWKLDSVQ